MTTTVFNSTPNSSQQATRSKRAPRKNPHSFEFYVDDFLGGTVHLSPQAVGAYVRLLCFQFNQGSIPDEPAVLARVCGCSVDEWGRLWVELENKFPKDADGKRRNERLASEKSHKLQVRKSCTDAALARWTKEQEDPPPDPIPKSHTDESTNKPTRRAAMPMPETVAEVENWCSAHNVKIDASAFFNYYASQGWKKANGKQVTDWHACARGWESRNSETAKANPKNMLWGEQRSQSNKAALRRVFG